MIAFNPEEVLVSTATDGGPGSGKTESSATKYVGAAADGICPISISDRHSHLISIVIKNAPRHAYKRRLALDQLSRFEKVLPLISFEKSVDPCPLRRAAADRVSIMAGMDLLWSAGGRGSGLDEKDIHAMPALSQAAYHAFACLLLREEPVSLAELDNLLMFGSKRCIELATTTTDTKAWFFWHEVIRLHRQGKDRLLEEIVGPLLRLWRQAAHPQLLVRCGTRNIWGDLIEDKKIVLIDGSDDGTVHPRAATAVFRGARLSLFQFLQRRYAKTGKECVVLDVLEEAAESDQIGPYEIDFFRGGRKFGWRPHVLTQDWKSFTDEARAVVLGCSKRHEHYNPLNQELALEQASDIGYHTLDPDLIAYVEETKQQFHDGFHYETRENRGESHDEADIMGKIKKRYSTSTSEVAVPDYRTEVRRHEHRRALEDQIKLLARELLNMAPGYRVWWQMTDRGVIVSDTPSRAPMLDDPYPEADFPGYSLKLMDRLARECQQAACFQTPVVLTPCEPIIVNPTPKKPKPKANPTRNGKPHARS